MTVALSSSPRLALQDRAAFVAAPEQMAFAALVERVHAMIDAWRLRRRLEAARREFGQLTPAMLRDLAIDATEFESYWAEQQGKAESTRRVRGA